jgi:uncharacterized protein YndB with AHSA1/START domain
MMNAEKATQVAKAGDREIHIERIFDAPRDKVFAAFTDPELIPRWWGPHGTTTIVEEMTVEAGGDWRFRTRSENGENVFRGTYREVSPPERLVQTFEWLGMPGHISVDSSTFEDLGERTKITTISQVHTPEERDGMVDAGMEGGLSESYERLDALFAGDGS